MYYFNWRTVIPLKNASSSGYNKSTSRWQTNASLWSLRINYSVIPNVSFICCSIIFSFRINWFNMADLRHCSTHLFYNKANIYHLTKTKKIFRKFTFALLCYNFKEFHPKKTQFKLRSQVDRAKINKQNSFSLLLCAFKESTKKRLKCSCFTLLIVNLSNNFKC